MQQTKVSPISWDDELAAIAQNLSKTFTLYGRSCPQDNKSLINLKILTIQGQLSVDATLNRLKHLIDRDVMLLPREKAIVHWGKVFLQKATEVATLRGKLLAKNLWVQLIKVRLFGPTSGSIDQYEDQEWDQMTEDLLSLSVRHKNLLSTERQLLAALAERNREIHKLTLEYGSLDVFAANRAAGFSLQARLGANLQEALANPILKALKELCYFALGEMNSPEEFSKLQQVCSLQRQKSGELLEICRNVAEAVIVDENIDTANVESLKSQYAMAIAQLDQIEQEAHDSYHKILAYCPNDAHPSILRNEHLPHQR